MAEPELTFVTTQGGAYAAAGGMASGGGLLTDIMCFPCKMIGYIIVFVIVIIVLLNLLSSDEEVAAAEASAEAELDSSTTERFGDGVKKFALKTKALAQNAAKK